MAAFQIRKNSVNSRTDSGKVNSATQRIVSTIVSRSIFYVRKAILSLNLATAESILEWPRTARTAQTASAESVGSVDSISRPDLFQWPGAFDRAKDANIRPDADW